MKTSADGKVLLACAKAMGYTKIYGLDTPGMVYGMLHPGCNEVLIVDGVGDGGQYNPMYDDAQAMQLVKRFNLQINPPVPDGARTWWVHTNERTDWGDYAPNYGETDISLNRAICLCVAKMQKPKKTEPATKNKRKRT